MIHGSRFSALLVLIGGPWRSIGNPLAVRILDWGPHFEYPWCMHCIWICIEFNPLLCTAFPPNTPSFLNHIPKSLIIAAVYLRLKIKAATFKSNDEPWIWLCFCLYNYKGFATFMYWFDWNVLIEFDCFDWNPSLYCLPGIHGLVSRIRCQQTLIPRFLHILNQLNCFNSNMWSEIWN